MSRIRTRPTREDTRDKLFTYARTGLLGTGRGMSLPEMLEEAQEEATK